MHRTICAESEAVNITDEILPGLPCAQSVEHFGGKKPAEVSQGMSIRHIGLACAQGSAKLLQQAGAQLVSIFSNVCLVACSIRFSYRS